VTEQLPSTELVDDATRELDLLPTLDLVSLLVQRQERALAAVREAVPQLSRAVDRIAESVSAGGALHYVGAGTSGRIGVLDAAEAPPTFGTPPALVRAHIAGGDAALVRAVEGAEDDVDAGRALAFARGDAVVGISASGGARYVIAAVEKARASGAYTIALTSVSGSRLAISAELPVVLDTGPEPLAGSTRMLAGTAQKIALNALSTATMVRLGKTYGNLMVDVVANNQKLERRAVRLVCEIGGVDEERARQLLAAASASAKVAIVMARRGIAEDAARAALSKAGGRLRGVLEG